MQRLFLKLLKNDRKIAVRLNASGQLFNLLAIPITFQRKHDL